VHDGRGQRDLARVALEVGHLAVVAVQQVDGWAVEVRAQRVDGGPARTARADEERGHRRVAWLWPYGFVALFQQAAPDAHPVRVDAHERLVVVLVVHIVARVNVKGPGQSQRLGGVVVPSSLRMQP
jgi:hypothetical protein